jgi:hypothetical protein
VVRRDKATIPALCALLLSGALWAALRPGAGARQQAGPPTGLKPDAGISIDYPEPESIFPPEFPPPQFEWRDEVPEDTAWRIEVTFADGAAPLLFRSNGERMRIGAIDPDGIAETNRPPTLTPQEAAAHTWRPEAKEQLEAFRKGRFIVTLPVDLPPGRYTVESVAADQRGGRFGAHRASFFAQAHHAGPELSGLTLLRRVEDPAKEPDPRDPLQIAAGRVVPTLSTHVPLGKSTLLSVFFKLYPDSPAKEPSRLVIDLLREGRIVSRSTPDVPAASAGGEIPYLANLPVGTLKPGQYEFRATLLQGNAADQKAIAVTLE